MDKKIKLTSVEVKLPPDEQLVSPLRLLISGLAARLGFDLDEIEDLKLTVGEAFLSIVEKCPPGSPGVISLKWQEMPETLTVRITDPSHQHTAVTTTPLLSAISQLAEVISWTEEDQPEITIRFRRDQEEARAPGS